ncbi:hypothetical protein EB796_020401 [Bugula neritina]|uniref:Tyrosine-protein phosphatase domain-containing protein n=1 Tax=Bugula neritina TaxID=10212 RepID=A0A7J7J6X7_BUGNE|nr:hypothetical protein EB796_020401 [Bugula neritina]
MQDINTKTDDHRVVLRREGEGNDFINASYIANKCEQYWPLDKQPKKFGDITVCSKSVECWADFTQTRLSISKVKSYMQTIIYLLQLYSA